MNLRNLRRLAAACLVLALAAPATALAHGRSVHGPRSVQCRALQNGHAPKRLTAAQVSALVTACQNREAALKAAGDAYRTARQAAYDAFRATTKSISDDLRAAGQARRTACAPDPKAQACADARAAYQTTVQSLPAKRRDAAKALRDAVKAAIATKRDAVKAAQDAFRAAVTQALQS